MGGGRAARWFSAAYARGTAFQLGITHRISKHVRLSEPTTKIWMKLDSRLYNQWRRCSPTTLDSDNIRFMQIFAGFPGKGASYNGVVENVIFRGFGSYVFGTSGNEANIIIEYYLVPCRLSTDPKIRDLEWLWMAWRAILRYMFATTNCHWLIIVTYLLTFVYHTDVTSGEVREAEYSKQWSAERQIIWNPRKICRSSVDAISSEP